MHANINQDERPQTQQPNQNLQTHLLLERLGGDALQRPRQVVGHVQQLLREGLDRELLRLVHVPVGSVYMGIMGASGFWRVHTSIYVPMYMYLPARDAPHVLHLRERPEHPVLHLLVLRLQLLEQLLLLVYLRPCRRLARLFWF